MTTPTTQKADPTHLGFTLKRGLVMALAAGTSLALAGAIAAQQKPKAPQTGKPTSIEPPADAKNLLDNGDFEKADETGNSPANWAPVDRLVWHWVDAPNSPDRGKVLKINTDISQGQAYDWWVKHFVEGKPLSKAPDPAPTKSPKFGTIGGLNGGFYWSDYIKIKKGGAYRVYVDAKGRPAKVFIRGYEEKGEPGFGDDQPAVLEVLDKARGKPTEDEQGRPIMHRLNYTYTTWFPVGGSDQWQTYSHEQPRHPNNRRITEDVRYIRIMLYPYWPADTYWFDNVRVYSVKPDPKQARPDASETELEQGKVVR